MLSKLLNVDILSALLAFAFALVATYQAPLAELCSPGVAFTFALAAAVRGVASARTDLALPSA